MILAARSAGARVLFIGSDSTDHPAMYLEAGADAVAIGEPEDTVAEVVGAWADDGVRALELAERLAPGTLDPAFRRTLEAAAPARMRRVVDDVARSGMQLRRRSLDDRMMWAAGPLGTLVAVADLLWPTGGLMEVARLYGRRAGMIGRREISVRATAP